ncbi:MAG: hypothetical protein IT372_42160 [Polyangiaceae bacterium]|nr:hypothetical protein [Polyangiaceae bacterium]
MIAPAPPPHLLLAVAWVVLGLGTVGLISLAELVPQHSAMALALMGACAATFGVLTDSLVLFAAHRVSARVFLLIGAGRLSEADDFLGRIKWARFGVIRRIVDVQRAGIALRRGDIDAAIRYAAATIARSRDLWARGFSRQLTLAACGLRAFLHASRGDEEGARVDIAAVHHRDAPVQALAHAALAEAILLERAGKRAELRAQLTAQRRLLWEVHGGLERAIARGYLRMVDATAATVYREALPCEEDGADQLAPKDLVTLIAPAAAAYVDRSAYVPSGSDDAGPLREVGGAPSGNGSDAASGAAGISAGSLLSSALRAIRQRWRGIMLSVFLTSLLAGVFAALSRRGADPARMREKSLIVAAGVFTVIVVQWLRAMRAVQRDTERARSATAALMSGDTARGRAELDALARSGHPWTAALAHLQLAHEQERLGAFAAALEHCEVGLRRLGQTQPRAAMRSPLATFLMGDRALLLCAMDRVVEARAALELLPSTWPWQNMVTFRVRLIELVRRNDLRSAAELIKRDAARSGLCPALSVHEEMLVDAVRTVAGSGGAAASAAARRLNVELRALPEARRWMEAVAPTLLAALASTPEG